MRVNVGEGGSISPGSISNRDGVDDASTSGGGGSGVLVGIAFTGPQAAKTNIKKKMEAKGRFIFFIQEKFCCITSAGVHKKHTCAGIFITPGALTFGRRPAQGFFNPFPVALGQAGFFRFNLLFGIAGGHKGFGQRVHILVGVGQGGIQGGGIFGGRL